MYDGQSEIVDAMKQIINDKVAPEKVDRKLVKNYLYTKKSPEVDYIIRCGMEDGARISGFLLWDASYAEFKFRDEYWPEYNEELLIEDLKDYIKRNRRKGK
jgi:undecaprenyl diphosphate synthase